MTLKNLSKAPFPWFGGKRKAAPVIWQALGDVHHYVEPFAGSLAVLLERPHPCNRAYYSETVNDMDGLLVNAWRSIQMKPEETAHAASNPVAEADLMARHIALVKWRDERQLEHLMGDPSFCDPVMAGWWIWGCSSWIGSGWCSGRGAWTTDETGRIYKQARENRRAGVDRKLPHLGDNGRGVNRPQAREPGVKNQRPHLVGNGQGVNHAGAREPGVETDHSIVEFHPVTMPEILRWFGWLSARLRHVRILNGDWSRAVTTGAAWTLPVRQKKDPCGIFLDPPYADTAGRCDGLYTVDSLSVAHAVREWCLENGDKPLNRIVLAGFEGEHGDALVKAGWREIEWFASGFLTGGMGNVGKNKGHQQKRERLWFSPHCLPIEQSAPPKTSKKSARVEPEQSEMFAEV